MRVLLVTYDNGSYIHWPPLGLMYLASVLRNVGHEVCVWEQDFHHWPDEKLTDALNDQHYDAVGVGVIGGYYQHAKIKSLAAAINASSDRPFFVIGGHGPSPEPEYYLKLTGADAVCCGESESIIVDVLENKRAGIHRAESLIDVNEATHPAWDLFPMDYYRLLRMPHSKPTDFVFPVLSGRGCPFKCNFCYRMDAGFRARSLESIEDEVLHLKHTYGITYVAFGDELLMSSEARAEKIATMLGMCGVRWECNGRLNYATPALLKHMKANGCVFINYGIESFDDGALEAMGKRLTCEQIVKGVEATLEAGISPGLNIIWGNIGESVATLWKGVEFLKRYDDGAQLRTIRPVTPYPGSPLYAEAWCRGLIRGVEDFYAKHVNSDLFTVNFMGMSNEEAHRHLCEANKALLSHYVDRQYERNAATCEKLYAGDATFRGFRQS